MKDANAPAITDDNKTSTNELIKFDEIFDFIDEDHFLIRKERAWVHIETGMNDFNLCVVNAKTQKIVTSYNHRSFGSKLLKYNRNMIILASFVKEGIIDGTFIGYLTVLKIDDDSTSNSIQLIEAKNNDSNGRFYFDSVKCFLSKKSDDNAFFLIDFNKDSNKNNYCISIRKYEFKKAINQVDLIKEFKLESNELKLKQNKENKWIEPGYCLMQSNEIFVYISFVSSEKISEDEEKCVYEIKCMNIENSDQSLPFNKPFQFEFVSYKESKPIILNLENTENCFIIYGWQHDYFRHFKIDSSNQLVETVVKLNSQIDYVRSSSDGKLFIKCSNENIYVYSYENTNENVDLIKILDGNLFGFHLIKTGSIYLTYESDSNTGRVRAFELKSQKEIFSFPLSIRQKDHAYSNYFCSNQKYVLVKSANEELLVFKLT